MVTVEQEHVQDLFGVGTMHSGGADVFLGIDTGKHLTV